jgi:hypothetical protein
VTGFIAPEFDEKAHGGLPGPLPAGEHIVWQGSPRAAGIARHVLKTRWIAGYFGIMLVWLVATGLYFGRAVDDIIMSLVIMTLAGAVVIGLARWYAGAVARATVYTITEKRVVMKFGVALPTAFNLPFAEIESVDVLERADGSGNIALRFQPDVRLAWLVFWPNVRGFRMARTEPQLICIDDVTEVAGLLATQLHANAARTQRPTGAAEQAMDGTLMPFPEAAE